MATEGYRTAMVERKWLGGSRPNIACLPRGAEFGLEMNQLRINMAGVQQRKRKMVEANISSTPNAQRTPA
jgi:hypothetical protein